VWILIVWIAILIYCLLFITSIILYRLVKKKFNLPKKLQYKRNKRQIFIEILILAIYIIGVITASISVYDNGSYRPLNPIPTFVWLALFTLVLFGCRGLMVKRFAKDSKEYYIYFAFAVWTPIMIMIAYQTTNLLFG
jgi:hypothetical protein